MLTERDLQQLRLQVKQAGEGLFQPGAALATLLRTRGPTFRRPGSRMLVGGNQQVIRGLSGGCPEADIIARAREVIATQRPVIIRYDRTYGLDALMEMGCGGELEVLLEPIANCLGLDFLDRIDGLWAQRKTAVLQTSLSLDRLGTVDQVTRTVEPALESIGVCGQDVNPTQAESLLSGSPEQVWIQTTFRELLPPPHQLLVFGRNIVADELAQTGRHLGWRVQQLDPRDWSGTSFRRRLETEAIVLDSRTSAVLVTYNYETDLAIVQDLLQSSIPYIGVLGSRRRAGQFHQSLRSKEGVPAWTERLRSPCGLDIGSEDPESIALSVVAEIKAFVAGRSGAPLIHADGAIHDRKADVGYRASGSGFTAGNPVHSLSSCMTESAI